MKSIDQLKAADGLRDVARLVGFKPKSLSYLLFILPASSRYTKFSIPKATGGTREIMAPVPQLKLAQRRLAHHLQNCLIEIEKQQVPRSSCIISHGFKRDLSIATNARVHVGRRWVVNIDLEDFFTSINFGRVRGFFMKNKHFSLREDTATVLAQIACHDNTLPQGAPTSPVISNLIAGLLDIRINKLASRGHCSFTRYADDITFSTNLREFPESIARIDSTGQWGLSSSVSKRIIQSGFSINSKKTRVQYRRSRQDVTGLIVNSEIGVKRQRLKTVRAQVESLINSGTCYVETRAAGATTRTPISIECLRGHLAHIAWVKGRYADYKRCDGHWRLEPGYVQTYRRFLDYRAFAASPVPTVICEGKTDYIYLQCAIPRTPSSPTILVDKASPSGIGVSLFRFTETTSWVQRLAGGTGDMKNLIDGYSERIRKINATRFRSPVVLVVDNDDGASKGRLNSLVKEKSGSKTKVDGSEDFYHLGLNLYIVYTPRTAVGGDTMIEDFLPAAVRAQKLGTKTLELDGKKFDPKKNFGKVPLAENIVRRQKDKIDFSAYLPLLNRIAGAIEHFDKGPHKA